MMERLDNPDDSLLSAYLDGELTEEQADQLTERLAREPKLMRRLEAMQSADAATRDVFATIDDRPMPASVLELLGAAERKPAATVIQFPKRLLQNFAQMPVAIAASVALVAGFLVNDLLREAPDAGGAFGVSESGVVAANSDLHDLLEHGLSAEPQTFANGATGKLVMTFEDKSGDYCRQLQVGSGDRGLQGVACRRDAAWQIEAMSFRGPESGSGPYGQASGDTPAALNSAIDSLIGSEDPLGKDEEKLLISNSWDFSGN